VPELLNTSGHPLAFRGRLNQHSGTRTLTRESLDHRSLCANSPGDQLATFADDHDLGFPGCKKLVSLRPPANWSAVIIAFIGRFASRYRPASSWDAKDAFRFIEANGGRLTNLPSDRIRHVRRDLLEVGDHDDFRWLVRWLAKEKHCEPAIYQDLTHFASVREKIAALDAGVRYLTPSQKMSRALERRRRAKPREETPRHE
jgi:hypothetical protein